MKSKYNEIIQLLKDRIDADLEKYYREYFVLPDTDAHVRAIKKVHDLAIELRNKRDKERGGPQ